MFKQTPSKMLKARVGGVISSALSESHNMEQKPGNAAATSFSKRNKFEEV